MSQGRREVERRALKGRAMQLFRQGLSQAIIHRRLGVVTSTISLWAREYKKTLTVG